MAADLSQFYQVFFEEAQEHLANMESQLLELDLAQPDEEEINAIFRAAHSIKGGAATFGFTDMADVTHVLETMLDRVRRGELVMTTPMVDAALVAGDVLKTLLAAHRGQGAADVGAIGDVCERLRMLASGDAEQPEPAAAEAEETAVIGPRRISFAAAPHAAENTVVVDNLLAELSDMGDITVVERPAPDQPAALWELRFAGGAADEELTAVLDFVALPGSVLITSDVPAGAHETDESFGLFDNAPATAEQACTAGADDAFGLFEPLAPKEQAAPPPDEGFGLFDEASSKFPSAEVKSVLPQPVARPPVQVATANAPKASAPQPVAKGSGDSGSIRVSVDKVDQMINLVGELVITQAMLAQSASQLDPVLFERLFGGLTQLERNTRDLQESVMSIRMLPISMVFSRFPRVVRDLSQKLGKQVELKLGGETTELDKGLIERITDPLTHLVRNSIDHGIEMPETRAAAGKPAVGTINLRASQQGGNIVIEVSDDGAGLHRERILAKARERGLPALDTLTDGEVWQLIFEPGFSTAEKVTEVSGRGVGMDVVRKNVAALGGRIEIESVAGVGTRTTVRLPLTLAILDGMSVAVGSEIYVIPLSHVIESLQPTRQMAKSMGGLERLLHVRGEYLPLIALHEVFGVATKHTDITEGITVILEADGVKAALLVDALVGEQQVVIKSLEANYRRVPGIAAATIMGDGRVGLILDVTALLAQVNSATRKAA